MLNQYCRVRRRVVPGRARGLHHSSGRADWLGTETRSGGDGVLSAPQWLQKDTGFLLASAKSEPSEAFKDDEVRVSARVEEIDSPGDADDWAKVLPAQIEESMPVAFSRDSILEQLGCLRLWGDAESEQNALDAISSRVTELLATGTGSRERIKEYRLGANFLASARANAFAAPAVGLGKTIEAGLILKELKLRGLIRRVLIVAPKGLVTQWVAEMRTHFGEDTGYSSPAIFRRFAGWRRKIMSGKLMIRWSVRWMP